MAMAVAKKVSFATTIVSVHSSQDQWGFSVQVLFQVNPDRVEKEHSRSHHDQFATYFAGKIDCIRSELESRFLIQNWEVSSCQAL